MKNKLKNSFLLSIGILENENEIGKSSLLKLSEEILIQSYGRETLKIIENINNILNDKVDEIEPTPLKNYLDVMNKVDRWVEKHGHTLHYPFNYSDFTQALQNSFKEGYDAINKDFILIAPLLYPKSIKLFISNHNYGDYIGNFKNNLIYSTINQNKINYFAKIAKTEPSEQIKRMVYDVNKKLLNKVLESKQAKNNIKEEVGREEITEGKIKNSFYKKEEKTISQNYQKDKAFNNKDFNIQKNMLKQNVEENLRHFSLDETEIGQFKFTNEIKKFIDKINTSFQIKEKEFITHILIPNLIEFSQENKEKFFKLWKSDYNNKIKISEELLQTGEFWKSLSSLDPDKRKEITEELPKLITFDNKNLAKVADSILKSLSLITKNEELFKERINLFDKLGFNLNERLAIHYQINNQKLELLQSDENTKYTTVLDVLKEINNPMQIKVINEFLTNNENKYKQKKTLSERFKL